MNRDTADSLLDAFLQVRARLRTRRAEYRVLLSNPGKYARQHRRSLRNHNDAIARMDAILYRLTEEPQHEAEDH